MVFQKHLISNISSFHSKKQKSIIKVNNQIKVLICTRNIFDATHVFGDLLFTDNYDWLEFLEICLIRQIMIGI